MLFVLSGNIGGIVLIVGGFLLYKLIQIIFAVFERKAYRQKELLEKENRLHDLSIEHLLLKREFEEYKYEKENMVGVVVDKTKAERENLIKSLSIKYSKELKELEKEKKAYFYGMKNIEALELLDKYIKHEETEVLFLNENEPIYIERVIVLPVMGLVNAIDMDMIDHYESYALSHPALKYNVYFIELRDDDDYNFISLEDFSKKYQKTI